ncbi:MAG: hypothetical protein DHS20C21_18510 [Gemmatimonadota bacterium]|nr:MAG: hypothetical protein DHS20C21_18510 [Gemmatimonadota bacterium]
MAEPTLEVEVVTASDDDFTLRRLQGTEELSKPFELHLEMLSDNLEVDFTQIVGQPISVKIKPGGEIVREFNGVVLRMGQKGTEERYAVYEVTMVPWFRLLDLRVDCHMYTEKTTSEIVEDVLGQHSGVYRLDSISTERDCCVRYRESDRAFVSRLLEEEGYYYYNLSEDGDHTLIIKNGSAAAEVQVEGEYFADSSGHDGGERISEFRKRQEVVSGDWAMVDFLYGDPVLGEPKETAQSAVDQGSAGDSLSVFDFPEQYGKYKTGASSALADWVKVRAAQSDARAVVYNGKSNIWGMTAGHGLTLLEHFREEYNTNYLVTRVTHDLEFSGAMEAGSFEESRYANEFTCLVEGVEFRPAEVTPKPKIYGVQSAVVAEAIDDQARVRVRFPWAEDSSWWVRVSQSLAGAGWGHQYHPRVDQEVLVTFLNGDPDLPVIVGRVYNGANAGPYSAVHSQGGVKTRSMEGEKDNFNEIRFEDEKGSEEVLVHAEKQLTVTVEADESRQVGGNRSEQVEKNVDIKIKGNRTESVSGNRSLSVGGNKEEAVSGAKSVTVTKDHTEAVEGDMKVDVAKGRTVSVGKKLTESAGDDISVSAGKAMTVSSGKDMTVTVAGEYSITVDKLAKLEVTKAYNVEAKEIQIEAKDKIVLKAGKASITLKKNGDVVIDGGKIDVKGSGDVKIKGSKVGAN